MPEKARRSASGTVLAFDFGLQRIGVAVGERETGSAHPLPGVTAVTAPGRFTAIEKLVKDRKSTRLNSSHIQKSRMPSSA